MPKAVITVKVILTHSRERTEGLSNAENDST